MSTEHQKYSTENQSQAIREYAERRNISIVRTYADEGKSGLRLDGRDALKRLIEDVQNGSADFNCILVYDVSRWGRFQDADESAFYEYTCKRAGITVHYCAEQFENDGSPFSTMVKGFKRSMAGEYSRELSVKVFTGQCRLIELGYRQGGPPGFGLRRQLIDHAGTAKGLLSRGEHKSIQTDRIVLVPGPQEEIETVRWIYQVFVEQGISEQEIAAQLNAKGILSDLGRPWTRAAVHQILINEKYIGNNVWNRVSFKLKRKRVRNQDDMLIRAENAYPSIVDHSLFEAARAVIVARARRYSDEEMLDQLRQLLERVGYLSGVIINENDSFPSSAAYQYRFGSLLRAYQLVGFTPDRDYTYIQENRALRAMYPDIVSSTIEGIVAAGGQVHRDPDTDLLAINGEFTVALVIVRCKLTQAGTARWKIRLDTGLLPDITIAIRMDRKNVQPLDYYLFPSIDITAPRLRIGEHNEISLDSYRFDSLGCLFDMAKRSNLSEVA
jgi:DNA invertase Pin-like site-specific DNA recombinase